MLVYQRVDQSMSFFLDLVNLVIQPQEWCPLHDRDLGRRRFELGPGKPMDQWGHCQCVNPIPKTQQGLVNVPFWVYWTSPYSSHYRPYT